MNAADEIYAVKTPAVRNGGAVTGGDAPHAHPDSEKDRREILANLSLANEIANQNLAQQNAVAFQQAMFQLQLAAVGKCSELILSISPDDPEAPAKLALYRDLFDTLMQKFDASVRTSSDLVRRSP